MNEYHATPIVENILDTVAEFIRGDHEPAACGTQAACLLAADLLGVDEDIVDWVVATEIDQSRNNGADETIFEREMLD